MVMAWWGCRQLLTLVPSIFCLPWWVWISVFGDFAIICNAWSSSQCMQIWHLHAIWNRMLKLEGKTCLDRSCPWHAGGQWEQVWEQDWYIHHYVGPLETRAREVPKEDSSMSGPEKLYLFNLCAPLSCCSSQQQCTGNDGMADDLPKSWVWDQSSCT